MAYTIAGKTVTQRQYNAYKQYKAAKATKNVNQIADARYNYQHANDSAIGSAASSTKTTQTTLSNIPWFVYAAGIAALYFVMKGRH